LYHTEAEVNLGFRIIGCQVRFFKQILKVELYFTKSNYFGHIPLISSFSRYTVTGRVLLKQNGQTCKNIQTTNEFKKNPTFT